MAAKSKTLPVPPSLKGKNIFLKPASPEDIANTHHWLMQSEPQTLTCHPRAFRTGAEEAEAYRNREKTADQQLFMIVREKDNAPVGRISFFNLNSLNRSAEIGLLVDPEEQQQGHGSEAAKVLGRYLFHYRGLNKIYLQTAAANTGMIRVAEKLGFHRDAVLRNHYYYAGEYCDGLIYSLLRFELDW